VRGRLIRSDHGAECLAGIKHWAPFGSRVTEIERKIKGINGHNMRFCRNNLHIRLSNHKTPYTMASTTSGLSDVKAIEFSETYRLGFVGSPPDIPGDSAEFIAFDADFGGTFAADWQDAIDACTAAPSDEVREDEQQIMTEEVKARMVDGRKAYRVNRYFVVKAFPGNISVQNLLALDDYVAQSRSQAGMSKLLVELNTHCNKPAYKPALLAAGYTQLQIDELLTLAGALKVDNAHQNTFIRQTTQATEDRRALYAHMWSFAQKVNAASKVIYMDDIVKLNYYTFPASNESPEAFDLVGTVTDAGTGLPIEGASIKFPTLGLVVATDENGKYGATGLPTGNVPIEVSMLGYVLQNLTADIPATGTATVDVALVAAP
jgi:hypothetical protein